MGADALLGCLARSLAAETLSEHQWSEVVDEAIRHGVAPILYGRLSDLADHVPALALARLHDVYLHNALRNATVFGELADVLLALRGEDIPVIVLKGAHLAAIVYPDRALRPMADVDLLVRPQHLPRAERQLIERGYSPVENATVKTDYATHHHARPFTKSGAIPIEIHRGITPARSPFQVDLDGIWARAREAEVTGIEGFVLAPDDLMHHLCLHAAYNHRFEIPLLPLCDLAATIESTQWRLDWRRFVATSNASRTSRLVYCTLRVLTSTLGADVPDGVFDELAHTATDDAVVDAIRDSILSSAADVPATYAQLGDHTGFRAKVGVLARSVFPSRDHLRAIYALPPASRLVYAYYLVRPLDLIVRRGRVVADIIIGAQRLKPAIAREEQRRVIRRWVESAARGLPEPPAGALVEDASRTHE